MTDLRLATEADLETLAKIFAESFTQASPEKPWAYDNALKLMQYWYRRQPDLFYVATEDTLLVGGMVTNIKPWRDGNRCQDGILFVDPDHQKSSIGTKLFSKILEQSIQKYQTETFEGITFAGDEFPLTWYKKLGIQQDKDAIVIKGSCQEMLNNLTKI